MLLIIKIVAIATLVTFMGFAPTTNSTITASPVLTGHAAAGIR